MGEAGFVSPSADMLNVFITVTALVVGVVQFLFLFNLVWSLFKGREASGNPWRATTLEWQTPETPPPHGHWGEALPDVYRWASDFRLPGQVADLGRADRGEVIRVAEDRKSDGTGERV